MIQTSYYQKSGSLPNAVGISQGVPKWYTGALYEKLAPPWEIVKIKDEATFRRLYHEMVLSHLNPVHVADELEGKVLLCWELPGQFCHRWLVAVSTFRWIGVFVNIGVTENRSFWRTKRTLSEHQNSANPAESLLFMIFGAWRIAPNAIYVFRNRELQSLQFPFLKRSGSIGMEIMPVFDQHFGFVFFISYVTQSHQYQIVQYLVT
jgi:hypothetical protein